MDYLADTLGDAGAITLAGLLVGLVFGACAEQSKFCLRAAAVEVARFRLGPRFAVWLLTFSTALLWTQALQILGVIDLGQSRWLASPGTIMGALVGGAIFGLGMVLARGCPGRLLVLGATGNLRAILSGLVFAVVAQMSLSGILAPLRQGLSGLWVTAGPNPNLLIEAGLPAWGGLALAWLWALGALWVSWRNRVAFRTLIFGCGVGFAAALGWYLTYSASLISFDPVPIGSLTFSGPSADVLMYVLSSDRTLGFDIGLVPGVFLAGFVSAWVSGRLRWQGWEGPAAMQRSLLGAACMGFGAMTAGGCTIGAGVTGGSSFALTAWVAVSAMWLSGMLADRLIDQAPRALPVPA